MYKGDWKGAPEGEYVLVEISPKIDIAKDDKSRLVMLSTYVPIEYINDNMFELPEVWSWPTRKPAPSKGSSKELTSKELLSDKSDTPVYPLIDLDYQRANYCSALRIRL